MREKYPFTGHFGNTHAVIPTTECVCGGGGGYEAVMDPFVGQ